MLLGLVLLAGAMGLLLHNHKEADFAGQASADLIPQLVQEAKTASEESTTPVHHDLPGIVDYEMTQVQINGHSYIGYLSVPELSLELPVMADWDYDKLQIAPCRYSGTTGGDDLVLMAHNYPNHFGKLSELKEGDDVFFTDMDGAVTHYQVLAFDVLDPSAVEEMVSGSFDLTLFTCTYGGKSRVTVYCDEAEG